MGDLVFSQGDVAPDNEVVAHATIVAIHHPALGKLRAIDAGGLEYTFVLETGDLVRVDAEGIPGQSVLARYRSITDWHVYVALRDAQFLGARRVEEASLV
jgi:hypothetical protein